MLYGKLIKTPKVKYNEILIVRDRRGLGDILMHRMIFEDIYKAKNYKITFACPKPYHDFIKDHPFVWNVVDSATVNRKEYLIHYDTSNCCIEYECRSPIADKHRADIWAEHCGVKLTNHNMFLPFISQKMIENGKKEVEKLSSKKKVLFCPIAYDKLRTLTDEQITGVVKHLRGKDLFIYSTHIEPVEILDELEVPVLSGSNEAWLSYIHAADYVITVDTSVFHYAGGISKPMVGIFTHVDGKYRGKYFDFILVQKHRDDGEWKCGPCYNYSTCSHPKCVDKSYFTPKPCLTELTVEEIIVGIEKLLNT